MSERLSIESSFVRNYETLKSYGTLVALPYFPGSEAERMFPNPQANGAVPFEHNSEGFWLVVIEWAISKRTSLARGYIDDRGEGRYHTWSKNENNIKFEDTIVISDEMPPAPQPNGSSYTLWTEAHRTDQLIINNKRMRVRQIPFSWDLTMSQKIDSMGNFIGPYQRDELETYMFPEIKRKGTKRKWYTKLDYGLIWDITEVQVKVRVQAVFPGQRGPPTAQLAKERMLGEDEKAPVGEARSRALIKDIEITKNARRSNDDANSRAFDNGRRQDIPSDQPAEAGPQLRSRRLRELARDPPQGILRPTGSSSAVLNSDIRRHDGCYTCKDRKRKCDCKYTFDQTTGSLSCEECAQLEITCYNTQNAAEQSTSQIESRRQVKLGKRRAREESGSPSTVGRGRSITVNTFDPVWQ